MKQITLSRGLFALVNDEDFEWLNQWKWSASAIGYAVRSEGPRKKRIIIFMHKQIMGFPENPVDHKNQNKLDNQRHNLRNCTHQQNLWNTGLRSSNKSGFKGVFYDKNKRKWTAQIRHDGKVKLIGRFDTMTEAIAEYDRTAIDIRGEFAVGNQVIK